MKKISALVLSAAVMCSCNLEENEPAVSDGLGSLTLKIETETGTKASPTQSQNYESKVNSLAVMAFDKNGTLAAYKKNDNADNTVLELMSGKYTVCAVANGPDLSSVSKLSDLNSREFALSTNSTDVTKGFVMGGILETEVSPGENLSCTMNIRRYTSRVQLGSVRNELPSALGDVILEYVFLCNVPGIQKFPGSNESPVWYNKDGRADETVRNASHIIDGANYLASCPDLTFRTLGKSAVPNGQTKTLDKCLLYSYPNYSTADPAGFRSDFTPVRTVLCVCVSIGGKKQYYPVTLSDGLERNKSYQVNLTIVGLGSDDPDKPVEKGSCIMTLSVKAWTAGNEINESI